MQKRTLLFLAFLCCLSFGLYAQDNDGDGVLDTVDLDDDNDGILDVNECEVPVTNFSFETLPLYSGAPDWISTGANFGWGHHDIDANNYLSTGGVPDGSQFLFLTTLELTGSATLNVFTKTFEEGTYTLTVAVGDGIVDRAEDNDGESIIEIGYGNNAASFIPLAQAIVDGDSTIPGTWTDISVPVTLTAPNPALGQGILVRITHTGTVLPSGTNAVRSGRGHYDNIRVVKDTDGDGLNDCFDLNSDVFDPTNTNLDCPDILEAGHTDANSDGILDGTLPLPLSDGTITGFATGYTGNTQAVLDGTIETCALGYQDNDQDDVDDFIDLDDDNDGILDTNECEINIANAGFENFDVPRSFIEDWFLASGPGTAGLEATIDGTNYFAAPEGTTYAFINNTAAITLNTIGHSFEVGDYNLSILIGDGIDFNSAFRNDGQSTIELGYLNGDYTTFQPVGAPLVVENFETPNGMWTEFNLTVSINGGDAALGQPISVRITHTENGALRQSQGNYDRIRVSKDTDRDGLSDCFDLDSDDPTNTSGCFDVLEAGHTDANADGVLDGSLPLPTSDGTVTGFATGYTGNKQAVLDGTMETCALGYQDNDQDGVDDLTDQDDDNDGIRDVFECEIPIANFGFEDFDIPRNFLADWFRTGTGTAGQEGIIDGTNYAAAPEGTTYAFINGTETITLNTVFATYEEGNYQLRILVGDGIDINNPFRNDGQSFIELGYHDGDYNNFQPITNGTLTIESHETVNGTWTEFVINGEVNGGDPAIGQAVSVRISHTENALLGQSQGNYDFIRVYQDRDRDGIIDCFDLDSDDSANSSGCPDVVEAGHTDAGGGFLGTAVDPLTGMVTSGGGYTGPRSQMWDATDSRFCIAVDTDSDGIEDGDYFRYDATNTLQTNIDVDNDNDGISDEEEDCDLLDSFEFRRGTNFEFPTNINILGSPSPDSDNIDFWEESGTGNAYAHLVNDYLYPPFTLPDITNFYTDGTLLPDFPDPEPQNDSYADLDGDVTITQTGSSPILEEGGYLLTIAVGDDLDFIDPFRNDGTTVIEVGYDTNPSDFAVTYNNLVTFPQINPEDTPNGTWTDFSYSFTIPAGSPAIGNTLSIRITHTGNAALNQLSGSYDHIRLQRDSDGDLIPDCQDFDSDEDGCLDVTEAGFDQDNDGVFDGGVTVNGLGGINGHSYVVDPTNLQNTRTPGDPVVITTDPLDATECEGSNASFTVIATRASGALEYEWAESTDGGVNWTILTDVAPYSGTLTDIFTITGVTTAQDGNQYRVRVSGDDYLCYEERIATLNVTPGPTLPTVVPVNTNICEGDDAEFTLTGDPNNIVTYSFDGGTTTPTVTLDGTGNAVVPQTGATADVTIDLISVEDNTSSCIITITPTPTTTATVTVNAEPSFITVDTTCAINLLTYDVDFTLSAGTVTGISEGVLTGTTVTGIDVANNLTVTVDNNGCIRDLVVTAPVNCTCPTILPPINPVDAAICEGNANVPVSIELDPAGLGDTIDWYDAGGTQVGTGLTFTSTETTPGTYSYFAEAVETASGCMSNPRVEVIFTIHPLVIADILASPIDACDTYTLPTLSPGNNYYTGPGGTGTLLSAGNTITSSQTIYIYAESGTAPNCTDESSFDVNITPTPSLIIDSRVCSTDRTTYTVNFTPSSGTATVTNSVGILVGNSVSDIPAGTDVTLTITENSCSSATTVLALDCTCPTIDPPINPIDGLNCEGTTTSGLSVDLPATAGDVINWYDAPTGGNLVGTGLNFNPTDTAPGVYPYYAETFDTVTSCTSPSRTLVNLTIIAAPIADVLPDANECGAYTLPPLLTGNNYYTGPGGTGTLLNAFDVITSSQTVYVFAQSGTSPNCSDETSFDIVITSLETPQNPINGFNCEGEPTATLSVDLPQSSGDTINWYDASSGGTLLATGVTFTPTETAEGIYSFFAENEDQISGCTSERIEVTLTITAIPIADTIPDQEACEQFVLPSLNSNNEYFTGPNGTGQQLASGDIITSPQTVYILASNPENTSCSAESSFAVDILNEPAMMLPETASLCAASGESVQLGMDLGPQYRYDWTPDNDTNNDGIEEPIFNVTQAGTYSLQIYQIGTSAECGGSVTYTTEVVETLQALSIEVEVTADGFELNTGNRARAIVNNDNLLFDQFEYSLDNPDGPFQAQNYFENIPGGLHRIYVRGLGDCGGVLESDPFLIVNYPTVFTPNGDGTNETWNILGTENPNITGDVTIQIFDRHGKLMAQIDPFGEGWDGTYNTRPVPSTDYWFIVNYTDLLTNRRINFNGHFSLIR